MFKKLFKKRSKRMTIDEIKTALGGLNEAERAELQTLLTPPETEQNPAETPQEQSNASETEEQPTEEQPTEEQATEVQPAEVPPAVENADVIEAVSARVTAHDTLISDLATRLETLLAKIEGKDFGSLPQPPAGGGADDEGDLAIRRYNPNYRK